MREEEKTNKHSVPDVSLCCRLLLESYRNKKVIFPELYCSSQVLVNYTVMKRKVGCFFPNNKLKHGCREDFNMFHMLPVTHTIVSKSRLRLQMAPKIQKLYPKLSCILRTNNKIDLIQQNELRGGSEILRHFCQRKIQRQHMTHAQMLFQSSQNFGSFANSVSSR